MRIYSYIQPHYPFAYAAQRLFDVINLTTVGANDPPLDLLSTGADQSTKYHTRFYYHFGDMMRHVYRNFINEVAPPIVGTRALYYQTIPTFRIQLPLNMAVGAFHFDREYNHQDGEITFWLPFTPAWDSNTIWVTESGTAEPEPVNLVPGQFLVFDSVNTYHGNRINTTGCTRLSIDFRCIVKGRYKDTGLTSVAAGRRMAVGDYWTEL